MTAENRHEVSGLQLLRLFRFATLSIVIPCFFCGGSDAQDRPALPFDREILVELAKQRAAQPHVEYSLPQLPGLEMGYEQYRSIRLQRGAAIWSGEDRNFTLDLFHPGFLYRTPVKISLVVGKQAREVPFTKAIFEYGKDVPQPSTADGLSYTGFRVRYPINQPALNDEFLVFQGASYFRAVARDQGYGLSARGLALRTARPDGEEFPRFTEFWIERPPVGADTIVVHALLESASVTGAYRFKVRPGVETVIDVDATLFPRTEVAAHGIAPLTSMFLFDASTPARFDDFRYAVHDSDGLQIVTGSDERLWRPLANPRQLQVSAFVDNNPKGFGLIQRKRAFAEYQDTDARYHARPSLWVEPLGEWGEGHVELVEIPSDREFHDNIVAYWMPRTPLKAGQAAELSYRMRWLTEPLPPTLARVVGTRTGQNHDFAERRSFVLDLDPGPNVPADYANLDVVVTASMGEVYHPRGAYIEPSGVYRIAFEINPGEADVVELRAAVGNEGKPWSETWLYRWTR